MRAAKTIFQNGFEFESRFRRPTIKTETIGEKSFCQISFSVGGNLVKCAERRQGMKIRKKPTLYHETNDRKERQEDYLHLLHIRQV